MTADTCCPIVELRQYTLHHGGGREALIALFEREFVESQEAVGARIIGQFRDLDDPDRFVWLRGFPDMPARAKTLGDFYGGPLWKAHRNAANATIVDSDNVLLLREAHAGSGFAKARLQARPAPGSKPRPAGVVAAHLHYLDPDQAEAFTAYFDQAMRPVIAAQGIEIMACFVTETTENNFKGLPVREKERVLVWFAGFPDVAAMDRKIAALKGAQTWREGASDPMLHQLERKPEVLRLVPAARSALRG
ncbi:MAG: NIPSNAP family protein [Proteobacteria bacterium]|nr:NIPSNAP family protein [Pseudomonadota bacterium]